VEALPEAKAMPTYVVRLTESERQHLEQMLARGRHAAGTAARARILLKADQGEAGPGWKDGDIVRALDTSLSTVHRVRQEFVERGLEAALFRRKPEGHRPRKLDGTQEAQLIALACGPAPEGRARWTLKLLARRLVELEVVDSIGPECVRTTLKKTNSSLG
jgi:transposase